MKKVKETVIIHERTMTEEETKAAEEELERYIAERMAYLKSHGFTSGEGWYEGADGKPHSISEEG